MMVDDGIEEFDFGAKKLKLDVHSITGSDVDIVQAEVGSHQPCRAF